MRKLVYDTETNGLELYKVTKIWCICAKDLQTGEEFQYGPDEVHRFPSLAERYGELVAHNQVEYDLPVLEKLLGWSPYPRGIRVTDTLILSRLSNPDRRRPLALVGKAGPHSIEAWAVRLGGTEQKVQHDDWSQFSPEMLNRCLSDVRIGTNVYHALCEEMSR